MKSKVIKLYDYTQAEVPAELRLWRVSDEKIDGELAALSRSHAQERDVEEVRTGDSVVCRGESAVGRWNKPVLLFYPGHGLCEKVLEDALIGMKAGENRTVAASEGDVTLTVTRVIRREAHPIDDELVKLEAVEGVETLADYRKWYREKTETWNRNHDKGYLARHLLNEIIEKSEYEIDQAEEQEWVTCTAEQQRKFDEMQGIDPTVPEEGTEFLTEEQVQQKYIDKCRPFFRSVVACPTVAVLLSGMDEEALYQVCAEESRKRTEAYLNSLSPEEREKLKEQEEQFRKQQAGGQQAAVPESAIRHQEFFNKAEALLRDYSEKLLEE